MSIRRTAALSITAAVILGGGATALAATVTHDAPWSDQQVAAVRDVQSSGGTSEASAGSADPSTVADSAAPDAGPDTTPGSSPSSSADPAARPATAGLTASDESSSIFGAMPTVPPGWTLPEPDGEPEDSNAAPFDLRGMDLGSLTTLARSVGIIVGEPVTETDGSVTVEITLPDDSTHIVRLQTDVEGRFIDATVDGTPIMEFVLQFLSGAIGHPHTTLPTIPPEWSLPD